MNFILYDNSNKIVLCEISKCKHGSAALAKEEGFCYCCAAASPAKASTLAVGARRLTVVARRAAAAGAAPMRSGGQNRRMNGSFRGRKKLLLEHMTKPAWMMTECFGSRRQRQRCARARKGVQGRARASNAEGGHTLRFFSKFVSWANNTNIYQPNEFPRKQKM